MKWEGCGVKKNSKPPEIRKKELIDTAAELFAEKGYEAVSIRDILEKVHGAPGMFYYYFKSKQDTRTVSPSFLQIPFRFLCFLICSMQHWKSAVPPYA